MHDEIQLNNKTGDGRTKIKICPHCGVLWSRGYFISTVGHISEATVKKYIEEQKDHD